MKFLHLADLHLGKKVNDFSMINDQKFVIEQIITLVQTEKIGTILISGDIFDKPIPTIEALELFENFLNNLNSLNINIVAISGNHDNSERLSYLASILKKSNIFINDKFGSQVQKVEIENKYCIYLLPYIYPMLTRNFYNIENLSDYNGALKKVIDSIDIDKTKINIILSHQFVGGVKPPVLSESETRSVGGVDIIDYKIYEKFDYTALGHLHCPQKIALNKIRYGGSILKYSFSEINQKKVFTIFEFNDDKKLNVYFKDIKFLHDLKEYKGYIDEFLSEEFYSKINTNDYIRFILKDDDIIDAKKKLSIIYPNIMILEFDNKYTNNYNFSINNNIKDKSILDHFCDFYNIQTFNKIKDEQLEIVKKLINSISEDV